MEAGWFKNQYKSTPKLPLWFTYVKQKTVQFWRKAISIVRVVFLLFPDLVFLLLDIKLVSLLPSCGTFLVFVKVPLQGKCLLAALLLTLKKFFATVVHHVSLQSTFTGTSRFCSDKGPFTCVHSPVIGKFEPPMASPLKIWPITLALV